MSDTSRSGPAARPRQEHYSELPEKHVSANQLVGYNMTYFRKAADLNQEELGERLGGWSAASVSAAERSWDGKRVRKFDADELLRIATVLNIPLVALFLPPEDAGVAVRYVLQGEDAGPTLDDLLDALIPVDTEDSPVMAAYRKRLIAAGVSSALHVPLGWGAAIVSRWRRFAAERMEEAGSAEAAVEAIVADATIRADSLERDAQGRHRRAMGSLVLQREELEDRIDDLRAFEGEYRSRLIAYLEANLRDLRGGTEEGVQEPRIPTFKEKREMGNS